MKLIKFCLFFITLILIEISESEPWNYYQIYNDNNKLSYKTNDFNDLLSTINDNLVVSFIIDRDVKLIEEEELFYLFKALIKKNKLSTLHIKRYDEVLNLYLEELLSYKLDFSFSLFIDLTSTNEDKINNNDSDSEFLIDESNSFEEMKNMVCTLLKSNIVTDKTFIISIYVDINETHTSFKECISLESQTLNLSIIKKGKESKVIVIEPKYEYYAKLYFE